MRLLYVGPPTLGELGKAGVPLSALEGLPINAIDVSQLELRPEEALAMGALPPSAREIPLNFGDLRRIGLTLKRMSALKLDPEDLAGFCEAATGRSPIDFGSRKSDGMLLSLFLEEIKSSSPAVRLFMERQGARDSLRIDTLGFAYLFIRNDSVFLRPRAEKDIGYRIPFPISAKDRDYGPTWEERMADFGTLPTFRIGFGYPDIAFAQAGLVLTQPTFSPHTSCSWPAPRTWPAKRA